MNKCRECGRETVNLHFCSRSCSASYNNRGVRRHGKAPTKCLNCGEETRNPKYCSNRCQKDYERKSVFSEIRKTGKCPDTVMTSKYTRRFLEEEFGSGCSVCGINEWQGKPLGLEVDHIDGNSENNAVENLRLICPNCHSQTPTYKAKNKKSGRTWRKKYAGLA